jgi:hypothetical protein
MKFTTFWVLAVSCLLSFFSPQAHAVPVDLNSFAIINPTAIVAADGLSAIISEDSEYAPVGIWDKGLFIPTETLSLSFNYKLEVAPYNADYFDFYFGDLSEPSDYRIGGYNDTAEIFIYEGTIIEDLTGFAGGELPIAFALSYDWNYDGVDNFGNFVDPLGSTLTISNVQMNPVPEPATLLLLGSGLLGIIGFRKRKISGAT